MPESTGAEIFGAPIVGANVSGLPTVGASVGRVSLFGALVTTEAVVGEDDDAVGSEITKAASVGTGVTGAVVP